MVLRDGLATGDGRLLLPAGGRNQAERWSGARLLAVAAEGRDLLTEALFPIAVTAGEGYRKGELELLELMLTFAAARLLWREGSRCRTRTGVVMTSARQTVDQSSGSCGAGGE